MNDVISKSCITTIYDHLDLIQQLLAPKLLEDPEAEATVNGMIRIIRENIMLLCRVNALV